MVAARSPADDLETDRVSQSITADPPTVESVDVRAPARRRGKDFVEKSWEFFVSIKLMVVLMALFAVTMAFNTFINPEEHALVEIERGFADRPWIVELYRFFELYAPFKSWWFTSIIVMLALNNLASSIERMPRIFLIVKNPAKVLTDRVLRGIRTKRTVPRGELEADDVEKVFAASGYKMSRTEQNGVTYLFGERGAWTRFGVWVVHLALLVVCFGGVLGRVAGYEGTVDISEHGGRATFFRERLPDGTVLRRPFDGYSIICDKFHLDRFKDGAARRFASDLRVVNNADETLLKKTIIVNDPLKWDNKTFYQATYQERPDLSHARIVMTDPATGETKEVRATPREPFTMGDARVRYTVDRYEPQFGELGPAVQVVREELGEPGTTPKWSSFWVFQERPDFDKLREDRFHLSFKGLEPLFITGIQVGFDPGVVWINIGFFVMFAGLFVTFWTSHRRVWARIEGDKVVFAGAAHRNRDKFTEEFEAMLAKVQGAPGGDSKAD